jgi:adenylate kinase
MQRPIRTRDQDRSILQLAARRDGSSGRFPAILLFGMPGIGKGTQGGLLGSMQGMFHVSTGDIFRGLDPDSENGKEIARRIDKGELVPDELTIRIWRDWIEDQIEADRYCPARDTLIMDGIPRSVEQCQILESHVDVLAVLHLACPDDEPIIERLRNRAITESRADDADECIVRKRLEIYRTKTEPVLEHHADEIVHLVNPLGTPMEIKKRILERIIPAVRGIEQAG